MAPTPLQPWMIQLQNPVFGRALLFVLFLPEGWHLQRGFAHPEIHGIQRRQELAWVTSADAHYLLVHEDGYGLECQIRVRPDAGRGLTSQGEVTVRGHPALVRRDSVRRGPPWRRRQVPRLMVDWICPETQRRFRIELVGRLPESQVQDLLQALDHLRCHHIPGEDWETP